MPVLETKHKRKSAAITAVILLLLLFVIFNYGMQYLDPPEEYGLAINFGDATIGNGESIKNSKKTPMPKVVEQEQEVVDEVAETPKEISKEDIIVDETAENFPVIKKVTEVKKEPVKEVIKKEIPKVVPKPKPSKEVTDALNSLRSGSVGSSKGEGDDSKGKGDDSKEGVKGNEKGDSDSHKYYGNTAVGSEGDYKLDGRTVMDTPREQPNCQEEGTVVVEIKVDKNGKVVFAKAGAKGTTNSAPCLYKPAEEAALKTPWNADETAPIIQTGTIIYKFLLTK